MAQDLFELYPSFKPNFKTVPIFRETRQKFSKVPKYSDSCLNRSIKLTEFIRFRLEGAQRG